METVELQESVLRSNVQSQSSSRNETSFLSSNQILTNFEQDVFKSSQKGKTLPPFSQPPPPLPVHPPPAFINTLPKTSLPSSSSTQQSSQRPLFSLPPEMVDVLSKRNELSMFDYSKEAIFYHQLFDEQIKLRKQQQQKIKELEQELLLKKQQKLQQKHQEQQLQQHISENEQTKSENELHFARNIKDLQQLVEFANEQSQQANQPPQQPLPSPQQPLVSPPAKRPKTFPAPITHHHNYPTPDTSEANENQSGQDTSITAGRSRLITINSSPLSKQKSFGFSSNEMESSANNNLTDFQTSTKSDLTQPDQEDDEEYDEDDDDDEDENEDDLVNGEKNKN